MDDAGRSVTVALYPEKIEVIVNSHPVASHRRSFVNKQAIKYPSHRTDLLLLTPSYKEKRIYLLMMRMNSDIGETPKFALKTKNSIITYP